MTKILYLSNYMSTELVNKRNNQNVFSQAGNNKVLGIYRALTALKCEVRLISNGLVSGKNKRFYPQYREKFENNEMLYCSIIGLPLLNTISSIFSVWKAIKREESIEPIDHIIFYNFKPETAIPAYLAHKKFKTPITVEFEDGYSTIEGIGLLKSKIFGFLESFMKKKINSALLVTTLVQSDFSVPSVVVRGVINEEYREFCKQHKKQKHEKMIVVYSGGLDYLRGIHVLLEAIKFCDFDMQLIIMGKGEIKSDDSRVYFKGFVQYNEMLYTMAEADVLIQCQLSHSTFGKSSFPSKLFEYIATGNYIISSDVSDVKIFAENKIAIYENDDPRNLAKELEKAYKLWLNGKCCSPGIRELCEGNLPHHIGNSIVKLLKTKK